MQEDVIYRCINPACARPMPRRVNFCPWCGTAQGQAAPRPDPAPAAGREAAAAAAAAAAGAGAQAAAAMSGWTEVPPAPELPASPGRAAETPAAGQGTSAGGGFGSGSSPGATSAGSTPASGSSAANAAVNAALPAVNAAAADAAGPADSSSTPAKDAARPDTDKAGAGGRATPDANGFGHAWRRDTHTAPPAPDVPLPPLPARPTQRKPVQLRWWILALLILWGVWLWAKPSTRKIDQRIDRAVALARECKGNEAQAELIALRSSRATPAQLEKLQKSLNDEAAVCTRRRQRNKAWSEASAAAEAALETGSVDKARTRLQGFIRRWGEDGKTRVLQERINEAADRQHPLAVPPGQS